MHINIYIYIYISSSSSVNELDIHFREEIYFIVPSVSVGFFLYLILIFNSSRNCKS